MSKNMEYCVIHCSVSTNDEAVKIAKELIRKKLIACCNIIPNAVSIYMWNNELQEDKEFLMIIKSRKELFEQIKQEIINLHSYEVPEIIELSVTDGNKSYLDWIKEQT